MKQKFLSIAFMLLFAVPMGWAQTVYEDTTLNLKFTLEGECATIKGVINDVSGALVIPATIEYEGHPYTVTALGIRAFFYKKRITAITLPATLTTIGEGAFNNCGQLQQITILGTDDDTNCLTTLCDGAFYYCSALTSFTLPASVDSIGTGVFNNCKALQAIEVKANNLNFACVDGVLFSKDKTRLVQFPAGKVVTFYAVPSGVTTVGKQAFYGCKQLNSLTLPSSLVTLEEKSFCNCSNLSTLIFTGYNDGTSELSTIDNSAFYYCEKLGSIALPRSLTTINNEAFSQCSALTTVSFQGADDGTSELTRIGDGAFVSCESLASFTLPRGVTTLGANAFYYCRRMRSIQLSEELTSIGNQAFCRVGSLQMTLPTMTPPSLGNGVFEDCSLTIGVPQAAVDAYKAAPGWSNYSGFITAIANRVSLEFAISAAGYATFYQTYPVVIPTGVEAYVVSSVTNGMANFQVLEGNILPACTPVILKDDSQMLHTYAEADENPAAPGTNLLVGCPSRKTLNQSGYVYYKLTKGSSQEHLDQLGFYYDVEGGTSITCQPNKAYLRLPVEPGAEAPCIRWSLPGSTHINPITETNRVTVVYSLQGVQMACASSEREALESLPKGLYLVNGKKVVKW